MPSALPEILEQALDKAPARRFASAADMRAAIDAAIRGETLIDAFEEATVARVSVADLMMPPHGLKSTNDLQSPPPPAHPQPVVEDDGSSRNPAIVAVIVIALTKDLVLADTAIEHVVVVVAHDAVIADTAIDLIVARTAQQPVAAMATVDVIVPGLTTQEVAIPAAIQ